MVLIDTVRDAGLAADAGNGKEDDKRQAAPPESTFEMDGRTAGIAFTTVRRKDAGNQKTAQERIKQAGKSNVQLLAGKAPAADDGILRPIREEYEDIPTHGEVQCEESADDAKDGQRDLGKVTEYKSIEDGRTSFDKVEVCTKI